MSFILKCRTCLYKILESNFWVSPVHLLKLTCFSFYIIIHKRKKVWKYLPAFQLSLTEFQEIQKKAFLKMKLLDILKTSCKSFSMKFLEVNNFLRNYLLYFEKLNKILWRSFLVNKRKRFNTISETKCNSVHLKYSTLLSLQQQSQDLSLLLLQGLDFLTLLSLDLLILCNELVMLSFPSLTFIVLFLQVFWSKFAILLKFYLKKTNHFSTKPSTLFLSPTFILPLTFSCLSKFFHCFPSLFLELFFSLLSICFGSMFIFFKSLC